MAKGPEPLEADLRLLLLKEERTVSTTTLSGLNKLIKEYIDPWMEISLIQMQPDLDQGLDLRYYLALQYKKPESSSKIKLGLIDPRIILTTTDPSSDRNKPVMNQMQFSKLMNERPKTKTQAKYYHDSDANILAKLLQSVNAIKTKSKSDFLINRNMEITGLNNLSKIHRFHLISPEDLHSIFSIDYIEENTDGKGHVQVYGPKDSTLELFQYAKLSLKYPTLPTWEPEYNGGDSIRDTNSMFMAPDHDLKGNRY